MRDVPNQPAVTVLTVAYDGAGFHGFARQPGMPTVQGRLESALAIITRRDVETSVAGRTDAGVHALAQVVSYRAEPDDPGFDELLRSVNALVGDGIVVTGVRGAVAGFSARYSALLREYRYRVCIGPTPPLFLASSAWRVKGELDLDAMREGAAALLGRHDFRSFCVTASAARGSTMREVDVCELVEEVHLGEACVTLRIAGRSFLHSMVRTVVGTLVEVGKGRRPASWVADALAACDRSAAGPTAPPHGLTLWSVGYPDDLWS